MRGAEAPSAKRCRRSVALDWQRADAFALTLDSVSAPSSRHGLPETDAAPDTTPSPVERRPDSADSRHTQEAIWRACANLVKQIDSSESRPKKATMIDENRYRRSPPRVPRRKWGPFSMKVRQLFRGECLDTPWPDPRLTRLMEKIPLRDATSPQPGPPIPGERCSPRLDIELWTASMMEGGVAQGTSPEVLGSNRSREVTFCGRAPRRGDQPRHIGGSSTSVATGLKG